MRAVDSLEYSLPEINLGSEKVIWSFSQSHGFMVHILSRKHKGNNSDNAVEVFVKN